MRDFQAVFFDCNLDKVSSQVSAERFPAENIVLLTKLSHLRMEGCQREQIVFSNAKSLGYSLSKS